MLWHVSHAHSRVAVQVESGGSGQGVQELVLVIQDSVVRH